MTRLKPRKLSYNFAAEEERAKADSQFALLSSDATSYCDFMSLQYPAER